MSRSKRSPQKAHISVRTFYRYFAAKEDVLQLRIERRSEVLRGALAGRPDDEPPLRSLRLALVEEFSAVDPIVLRRWIAVVADNPNVMRGVVGAIQLKIHPVIAEFFGARLGLPGDALVPHDVGRGGTRCRAGSAHPVVRPRRRIPATTMSESLAVLERTTSAPTPELGRWPEMLSKTKEASSPGRRRSKSR